MTNKIINLIHKIRFEIKCREADHFWSMMGGDCFNMYPPSFFMKHTPEEAERIQKEEIGRLNKMVDDYIRKNRIKKKA